MSGIGGGREASCAVPKKQCAHQSRDGSHRSTRLSYYFMGKDNITFHSQIWPAELLAYAGGGSHGGAPHTYGVLNLPTEVVSSEFLTMEGLKFSSSKKVVIYVRDLLARYQPDTFRYFVAAAGPESQDSDFTWAEFVRRTNDELVAGWATSSPRRDAHRQELRGDPDRRAAGGR